MFVFTQKVLFKHCDPAGIVFYPRYFEMLNDVVEAFFDSELNHPFEEVIKNGGVPTVQINATFSAPSRHGDTLKISLDVARLGRSSLDLGFQAFCESQLRFCANSTLVLVDTNGESRPWPDSLRRALTVRMCGENQ